MRRFPKQARSKAKVDAIVAAATELLKEVGYEGLSTADVAKKADVAVGTLYQFFDNKDDIMQAIAEEHVEKMVLFRQELFGPDVVYVPIEIMIGRTVDWLVDHNRQYPTFHHIFDTPWNDPQLVATLEQTMGGIIEDLAKIIRHHAPHLEEPRLQTGAAVLVYVIKGMFGLLNVSDEAGHDGIVREIKQLSYTYFLDLISENDAQF